MSRSRWLLLVPNRTLQQRQNDRCEVEIPRIEASPTQILTLIPNMLSVGTVG
jgi:hypothetical protein